ncbi:MAG: phosphoribosylanthranilate isomerase [Crocinitomicaceae bacterium]|nr:phosphoribosylanthranilate isomerase [Crocinitomicaceae bacterium]
MLIKVCGLKDPEQVAIISKRVDFIGFIFYPKSKRYIDHSLPSLGAKKTGVFVNERAQIVLKTARLEKLDAVQLHGEEQPEECAEIHGQLTVIKSFSIHDEFNFDKLKAYENHVDYFLFDTKSALKGGTGVQFNWGILSNYKDDVPFFLSGGISPDSLEAIRNFKHKSFAGIDLNSRFEIEPGKKDIDLLNTFLNEVRNN